MGEKEVKAFPVEKMIKFGVSRIQFVDLNRVKTNIMSRLC